MSSVWNFCRWVADVPRRKTFPAAKSVEKRMPSRRLFIRELTQQRRRRLRKRHLKSEFAVLQSLSRLFHLVYFVKYWQMFLELNSKGLYQSLGKEKESCCVVFSSSIKREIRNFHVVVVQRRQRNVQTSVMHVQSCCFADLNLCFFAVLVAVAVVIA